MRVLVWQWGRRGAGPRFAASLADGLRLIPGTEAILSLSTGAEILQAPAPPHCDLPVATYAGVAGLIARFVQAPLFVPRLSRRIAEAGARLAVCAMPGPLDLLMLAALRRLGVPAIVVVHDADAHPGDGMPFLMPLQRRLTRRADAVVALSAHVGARLSQQGLVGAGRLFVLQHPPFTFGSPPPPPRRHGGPLRLLCFGRLFVDKGLDLLAGAVQQLPAVPAWELRVVGSGPESAELAALRAVPGVVVENRWVPEDEVGSLIAWADALVLPYKEASQSGIAPAGIAAGRFVVSTRVGGLIEQLRGERLASLCEPDAMSLAAALGRLIEAPWTETAMPSDPRLAWRDLAERLLRDVMPAVRDR